MNLFRSILASLALLLLTVGGASAQCGTTAPANKFCGNDTGASALATWKSIPPSALSNIAGGTVFGNRGTTPAAPAALTNPVLGIPGTSTGEVGLAGSASGTAVLRAQAAAGSAVVLMPTAAGTLAASATSPLALNATTGLLTCPTCVTSSGGGAITGTAPISVSAAGVVSINAPYVTLTASNGGIVYSGSTNLAILAGTATAGQMLRSGSSAAPSWSTATWPATAAAGTVLTAASANTVTASSTPVLGVAGSTVGSLGFQNATSGTVTLQPVTGALGTVTINIPAAAGTMAVSAVAPITLSAAGAIGITGAALTKTDDTNVTLTLGGTPASALVNAASLTLGWTGQLSVARGGTGIGSGTSGGIPYFSGTGTIASSGLLAANQLVLGGGAGTTPATLGSLGTTTTILHGNAAGAPSFSSLVYADIATASIATSAQYLAGTSSLLVQSGVIYPAEVNFGNSGAGTQVFDFSTFINGAVTMTGNITTQNLSNVTAGKAGMITFIQDGTGNRTTVWNSAFHFASGVAPTLSTTAGAVDILFYSCRSATYCAASLGKAF